jgi:hypothetical protein
MTNSEDLARKVLNLARQGASSNSDRNRRQGPKTAKATQTHSVAMEDHTKETMKTTTEGPEFEMPSHYMKEVVAYVKTKEQCQPVKTKKYD